MRFFPHRLAVVALLGTLVCSAIALAAPPGEVSPERQEFEADHERIRKCPREFDAGRALADELQAKWGAAGRNPQYYASLICSAAWHLCSVERSDNQGRHPEARKHALLALRRADEFSPFAEWQLLTWIHNSCGMATRARGRDWSAERSSDMRHWFHAIQRVQRLIDPQWAPNKADFVPGSWIIPRNVRVWTGGAYIDPEKIPDPQDREDYVRRREENRAKHLRYNEQHTLHKIAESDIPSAERYIITAYSCPPYALEELRSYLDEYRIEPGMRQRILQAVEAATGITPAPPKP